MPALIDEDAGAQPDLMEGQARATIMPFGAGTVMGTAMFTQVGAMVTVVIELPKLPRRSAPGAHPPGHELR